jgi:N-acetylglucosaminyldiphosphoundecaprenol N-acetyl-beta-D-mannosaminyltransferase
VGLGFPKQERVIAVLRKRFPRTWFLGIGISIHFVGGDIARAPRWMQRLGLEWVHRLAQEPRRLAKRYLVHGLPFAARLLAHGAFARLSTGRGTD